MKAQKGKWVHWAGTTTRAAEEELHSGFGSASLNQMARQTDLGIFWVVLLAAVFWTAIWEHDKLVDLYRKSPVPALFRHTSDRT
jgi:hypothetical protein